MKWVEGITEDTNKNHNGFITVEGFMSLDNKIWNRGRWLLQVYTIIKKGVYIRLTLTNNNKVISVSYL